MWTESKSKDHDDDCFIISSSYAAYKRVSYNWSGGIRI